MSRIIVDLVDGLVSVETISAGETVGHSVLLTPAEWVGVVEFAESLEPVRELRRERSVRAAREASSHATRGAA